MARARERSARRPARGTALVIVESPAKARTIGSYLGAGYMVKASVGHVRDLPTSRIGVDIGNDFEPEYVVIDDKKKVVRELRDAAGRVEIVYLAPDPDREGEAIAWHIAEELRSVNPNLKRVLFNEITRKGVTEAIRSPTVLDQHRADAQQARRILDRLVGYQISPILWRTVGPGLSAGRVQSVAVRLVVDREAAISAFVAEEYWSVECECKAAQPPLFMATVRTWNGKKAAPKTESAARIIAAVLEGGRAEVTWVKRKQRRRRPPPPFVTSTLQQEASRSLRFAAKRTMALAQRLYEGVDLGATGPVGLITYMRTDSTRVSDEARAEAREFIGDTYGRDFLPKRPNVYKTKGRAQDAHEAIRPTSTLRTPEAVRAALMKRRDGTDLLKLYRLIWRRFVASHMTPAVYDQTAADITRGRAVLRATGQVMRFAGYTRVYTARETDDAKAEKADRADKLLPPLEVGDPITLTKVVPEQHFTKPPPRFTEASLVKELEERGIGRPSTYASILSTVVDRGYVEIRRTRLWPTELGTTVNTLLVASFPRILDPDFTAQMEQRLDEVERGDRAWRDVLAQFYGPFAKALERAGERAHPAKPAPTPTEHTCDACGAPMVERDGKFGRFLSCSRYPACKTTRPISIGVACPEKGCGGFVTERRSRQGKVFYGCSNFAITNCDFVTWDRPDGATR